MIILIHYIIVIPVGIGISRRTIVATWVGVLAILFFIPSIKNWQIYLLAPIIVFVTSRLYLDNHDFMKRYGNRTNATFNKLLLEIPKSPAEYKGIILYASPIDIQKRNKLLAKKDKKFKEDPKAFIWWANTPRKAGFKSVINCNGKKGLNEPWRSVKNLNKICKEVSIVVKNNQTISKKETTFYRIIGEFDGRLIISVCLMRVT